MRSTLSDCLRQSEDDLLWVVKEDQRKQRRYDFLALYDLLQALHAVEQQRIGLRQTQQRLVPDFVDEQRR